MTEVALRRQALEVMDMVMRADKELEAEIARIHDENDGPSQALVEQIRAVTLLYDRALATIGEYHEAILSGRLLVSGEDGEPAEGDERAEIQEEFSKTIATWRKDVLKRREWNDEMIEVTETALRNQRALAKAGRREEEPVPFTPPPQPAEPRCACGKAGYHQDEEGTWRCKRHAHEAGLLTPPTKEDEMETTTEPRFPDVTVELTGLDGNAFAIMGRVRAALHKGGASQEEIELYLSEATSGSYDDLLATTQRWVEVA